MIMMVSSEIVASGVGDAWLPLLLLLLLLLRLLPLLPWLLLNALLMSAAAL
jgi:hypothetical protein